MRICSYRSLAVAAVLGFCSALSADWPRFRGVSADGISTESGWLGTWPDGSPRRLWKVDIGRGFSSVVVVDGRVFAQGFEENKGGDTIIAVDAADGKPLWRHTYPEKLDPKFYEGGTSATPTVANGKVYTISKSGIVLCLNAADGKVLWERNLEKELKLKHPEWGYAGSPHLEGDLVVYNAGTHGVALKQSDGSNAWVSGTGASGYSTPVPFTFQGKRLLGIFGAKHLCAVDPTTGTLVWQHPWETSYDVNAADPVFAGDHVFLSSGYDKGASAVSLASGQPKELWFNKEMRNHMASSVIIGDYVYGQDGQGGKDAHIKCLELKTGKVVWKSPAAESGSTTVVDGRLVWLTGKGEVVVIEAKPDGYKEVARAQAAGGKFWTAPVVANGRLYVRNWKGELVCLDVKGKGPVI